MNQPLLYPLLNTSESVDSPCLHHLFERQAKRIPEKAAIRFEEKDLSYSELEIQANRFARLLLLKGVQKGDVVGVSLPPGFDLAIALLGILKIGAAYCPLDPSYPSRFLEGMILETPIDFFIKEIDKEPLLTQSEKSIESSSTPQDLAYLIYTSGSTGKPKGVAITHESVVNVIQSFGEILAVEPNDILFSVTPISFDIFGLEFFLPLSFGATCQMAPRSTTQSAPLLMGALEESRATLLQATPATWRMLTELNFHNSSLRHLLCGGESWDMSLAKKIFSSVSTHCQLWNVYGPTETTIWSLYKKIDPSDEKIFLGDPLPQTSLYILDEELSHSFEGELYIEGIGLARGYWKNRDLTSKKFIDKEGARLYRTGDRVRREADGELLFLGRFDDQVKIRGHRIELGQIEGHLQKHNLIDQVVCVAATNETEEEIHAFLKGEKQISSEELYQFLSLTLPQHMLPAKFHYIEAFPLTLNGKVDRKILRDKAKSSISSSALQNSSTGAEESLRKIWGEILKTADIQKESHFFHLGGHSLLAVRLLSRLRREFGISLGINDILENLVFSKQLSYIESKIGPKPIPKIAIPSSSETNRFPLSYEQRDYFQIDQDYEGGKFALYSPSAWRIKGPFDRERFENAFQKVIQRHPILRVRFLKTAEQQIEPFIQLPLSFENLTPLPTFEKKGKIEGIFSEDEKTPFDLFQPPLFSVKILQTEKDEFLLLMNNHHIILDGWSKTLLFRDLCAIYRESSPIFLAPAPSYGEFVSKQEMWLKSGEYQKEITFWKGELKGDLKPLRFDFGQKIPSERTFKGAVKSFQIPLDLTNSILDLCREVETTLFQFLLAIFSLVASRFTKEKKWIFSTVVAGRYDVEMEETLGNFINTVLIQIETNPSLPFSDFLFSVKKRVVASLENQRVPFDKVLEEVGIAHTPYHDLPGLVMLILHNTPKRELDFGEDITTEKILRRPPFSVLDLILDFTLDEGKGLLGTIEYTTDLYTESMVETLLHTFILSIQKALEKQ